MNSFKTLDWLEAAPRWFGRDTDDLGAAERKALSHAVLREALTEDPNHKQPPQPRAPRENGGESHRICEGYPLARGRAKSRTRDNL